MDYAAPRRCARGSILLHPGRPAVDSPRVALRTFDLYPLSDRGGGRLDRRICWNPLRRIFSALLALRGQPFCLRRDYCLGTLGHSNLVGSASPNHLAVACQSMVVDPRTI